MSPNTLYKLALAITVLSVGIEFVGWYNVHSESLLADGIHMTADMLALILGHIAVDTAHGGVKRASEKLLTHFNHAFLLCGGLYLTYQGIERLLMPVPIGKSMVLYALAGFICNGIQMLLVMSTKEAHSDHAYEGQFWHFFTDLMASGSVVAVGFVFFLLPYYWLDGLVAAGIGVFTLVAGVSLVLGKSDGHSHHHGHHHH